MGYVKLDKQYMVSLAEKDKRLARDYRAYLDACRERRLLELIHERQLAALPAQKDEHKAKKALDEFLKRTDAEKHSAFRQAASRKVALAENVRKHFYSGNPKFLDRQAFLGDRRFQTAAECDLLNPPYDFPVFCPFKEVRYLDVPGGLFAEVVSPTPGVLPDGALNLTRVYITARGRGQSAWISAAWSFKAPTQIEICKFSLAAHMSVEGLIDNKSGSSVKVQMDAGITQYRVDKPWDQINPSMDPYYRNLRAPCQDPGNTLYTEGYVDDTYGLHSLTPLHAGVRAEFSQQASSACYNYQDNDTFFVGYWCSIDVDENSEIQFEHNDLGTIVMHKPQFELYTPATP